MKMQNTILLISRTLKIQKTQESQLLLINSLDSLYPLSNYNNPIYN